jgi:hypothetical protein
VDGRRRGTVVTRAAALEGRMMPGDGPRRGGVRLDADAAEDKDVDEDDGCLPEGGAPKRAFGAATRAEEDCFFGGPVVLPAAVLHAGRPVACCFCLSLCCWCCRCCRCTCWC